MFHDGMKRVSLADMEKAIGEVLSKLSGVRYDCDISSVDLTTSDVRMSISLVGPNFFDTASQAEADAEG